MKFGRAMTRDDVEAYTWFVVMAGDQPPLALEDYLKTEGWLNQWVQRVARWCSTGFDLLLTPTVREPPAMLAELTPSENELWTLQKKMF